MKGFPPTVLQVMETYLSDSDLSSLARCCKGHMVLCYLRAKRYFKWGEEVSYFHFDHLVYPSDQFLQMQLAKMSNTGDLSLGKNVFYITVPYNLSFAQYMERICFTDSSLLRSDSKHGSEILWKSADAKCSFAVQTNNVSLYNRWKSNDICFLMLALTTCRTPYHDITILRNELKCHREHAKDILVSATEVWSDYEDFYFYEHALVCTTLLELGLYDESLVSNWFSALILLENGPSRCENLRRNLRQKKNSVLQMFYEKPESFIYLHVNVADRDALVEFSNTVDCSVKTAKAYLQFGVTRRAAGHRVRAFKKHKVGDYDKF